MPNTDFVDEKYSTNVELTIVTYNKFSVLKHVEAQESIRYWWYGICIVNNLVKY